MTQHEHPPRPDEERREFSEEAESLWRITLAPATWAMHFVICYATMSLACSRQLFEPEPARLALVALTVCALALIGWLGWRSLRQWNVRNSGELSHPEGEAEDRHHFLGHAAFLLSIISFIGTGFVALPLLLLEGCQ